MPWKLVWTQQPTRVRAGKKIQPAPCLELHDENGALAPYVKSAEATVRLFTGPAGGQLMGTTTVRGEQGRIEFDDLHVEPSGDYTLIAELDEQKIEYLYPGLDDTMPGLIARYQGRTGSGLVDIFGDWPTLAPVALDGTPQDAFYGIPTPIGPLAAEIAQGGRWWEAREQAPASFDHELTILAYIYHPGTSPEVSGFPILEGSTMSGGSWLLRGGWRLASPNAVGALRPEVGLWNGSTYRTLNLDGSRLELDPGFHLVGLSVQRTNDQGRPAAFVFLDGTFIGETAGQILDAPLLAARNWQRIYSGVGAQGAGAVVEIAIFDRRLELEEHQTLARRYGVLR